MAPSREVELAMELAVRTLRWRAEALDSPTDDRCELSVPSAMPDVTGHADFETILNFKRSFRPVHRYRAPMSGTSAGVAESPDDDAAHVAQLSRHIVSFNSVFETH